MWVERAHTSDLLIARHVREASELAIAVMPPGSESVVKGFADDIDSWSRRNPGEYTQEGFHTPLKCGENVIVRFQKADTGSLEAPLLFRASTVNMPDLYDGSLEEEELLEKLRHPANPSGDFLPQNASVDFARVVYRPQRTRSERIAFHPYPLVRVGFTWHDYDDDAAMSLTTASGTKNHLGKQRHAIPMSEFLQMHRRVTSLASINKV